METPKIHICDPPAHQSHNKFGTVVFQKLILNIYLHTYKKFVGLTLIKNAQTCAELPAIQNIPLITK